MSTTFGVKIKSKYLNQSIYENTYNSILEVAHRGNGNGIRFTNPIASLLPNYIKVIPLDNSAQGIFTIGDIKKEIEMQQVPLNNK